MKQYIEENKDRFLEELFSLIRIPSISSEQEHKGDMVRCAERWKELLLAAGADKAEVMPTEGNPVVYGEKTIDPSKPTVLVYGHYDVMPVAPLELWRTEPFEPVVKDGKIWARGADDDKGQSFMHAKAFEYMVKTGTLPCNVKFMLEGEEEIGSGSLYGFCEKNKELLKADIILVSDTSMIAPDVPSITSGLRGLCYWDNILFISNKGIMYKLKCYEVPDGSKASRGFNLINLLPLTENEKIAAMIKTTDFSDEKFIVMATKNGKIKRTNLSMYKNVRKNGLIAIGLDEGDEIAGVRMTEGNEQVVIATHNGMAIRLEEDKIREGDYVVGMARVREGAALLTVTENGYGKRTDLESYRIQNRGGYGLTNYKVDEIRGHVCNIKIVDEEDDIILVSSDGIIIRILASDVRIMGRIAKGVRVMKVNEGAAVVAFTRAEHDDSAETEKVEQLTEEQAKLAEAEAAEEEKNEVIIEASPEDNDDEE